MKSTTKQAASLVEIGAVNHLQYLFSMPYRRKMAAEISRTLREAPLPGGALFGVRLICEDDRACCGIEPSATTLGVLLEAIEDRCGLRGCMA